VHGQSFLVLNVVAEETRSAAGAIAPNTVHIYSIPAKGARGILQKTAKVAKGEGLGAVIRIVIKD
jgi:hypothetical protein